jgi:hypothetical protein
VVLCNVDDDRVQHRQDPAGRSSSQCIAMLNTRATNLMHTDLTYSNSLARFSGIAANIIDDDCIVRYHSMLLLSIAMSTYRIPV